MRVSLHALSYVAFLCRLGVSARRKIVVDMAVTDGQPTVTTSFGDLHGGSGDGCQFWSGIPYAKAPIGDLRFKDPQPWKERYPSFGRKALEYGPVCPQGNFGNEDCLFLNVWRPANIKPGEKLSALVWLHGGYFGAGASSSRMPRASGHSNNIYDGCRLASSRNVVVVSLNYRLGMLGFAAFEDAEGRCGNLGLRDQRLAFQWLQKEAEAFSIDAGSVTLFGENSGAMMAWDHMVSPPSQGLFHKVISESGFPFARSWEKGVSNTRGYATRLGCLDAARLRACLRKIPALQMAAVDGFGVELMDKAVHEPLWAPVVDGVDLPEYPERLLHGRRDPSVPILVGANTDAGESFLPNTWMFTAKKFHTLVNSISQGESLLGSWPRPLSQQDIHSILQLYKPGLFDRRLQAKELIGDMSFWCRATLAAQELPDNQDVFMYRFDHRTRCHNNLLYHLMPGVTQGMELQYVFGNEGPRWCWLTNEEKALQDRIQTIWTNFAKYGVPSGPKSTAGAVADTFPKYTNSSRQLLVFRTPADEREADFRGKFCELWQRVVWSQFDESTGAP